MKFKKNYPFLDEVTAHGELFKGPREVFICPECGSEHVKMGEIAEFGLPNEGILRWKRPVASVFARIVGANLIEFTVEIGHFLTLQRAFSSLLWGLF